MFCLTYVPIFPIFCVNFRSSFLSFLSYSLSFRFFRYFSLVTTFFSFLLFSTSFLFSFGHCAMLPCLLLSISPFLSFIFSFIYLCLLSCTIRFGISLSISFFLLFPLFPFYSPFCLSAFLLLSFVNYFFILYGTE